MTDAPNGNAVNRHLHSILASPGFIRSKRLSAFLSFVVTRTMAANTESITERNIALDVYGRPPDFDPKVDGIVRAEAIRLRHKLREYYASASEDGHRIDIPKGGYVPVFIGFEKVVGPPPTEITVERRGTWLRALAPFAILGIAVVLVALAGWRYVESRPSSPIEASKLVAEANARRLVGDEFTALALLDRAVAINPKSVDVHLARAVVFEYLGHLKGARVEIERAQELAALQGIHIPEIAVEVQALDGDFKGALRSLQEMLVNRPRTLELLLDLARREMYLDTPMENAVLAHEICRSARQFSGASGNPELDRLEALSLGIQGKNREAIELALSGERKAAALNASFSLGRLTVLEGGLRANDGQVQAAVLTLDRGRNLCLNYGDDLCVAITYRVEGNVVLGTTHQYTFALRNYKRGLAIASELGNETEMQKLLAGVDEAAKDLSPQLTAMDFLRSRFELISEPLR